MDLSRKQFKTLKLISKGKLDGDVLTSEQYDICSYLMQLGYISFTYVPELRNGHFENVVSVSITQSGRSLLWSDHRAFYRVTLPDIIGFVISGATLAVAIISLLFAIGAV